MVNIDGQRVSCRLAQVFWELPFVLIKTKYLHPLRSTETLDVDELWTWPFWMYGSGDTRYMRFHPETHATETMLALSGPFELYAAYCLAKGTRYKLAMVRMCVCRCSESNTQSAHTPIREAGCLNLSCRRLPR